jgi:hypothetical protein
MIFCACCLFIAQARPADYTLYSPVTFSTITAFNTSTWQPSKTIPAVNSGNFVLSADGNTFYASVSSENRVVAIDRTSGSVLHVYTLTYPLAAGLAILPNQSQLYVGTCASYLGSVGCVGGEVEVFDVTSEHHLAILSMGSDNPDRRRSQWSGSLRHALLCPGPVRRRRAARRGDSGSGVCTVRNTHRDRCSYPASGRERRCVSNGPHVRGD